MSFPTMRIRRSGGVLAVSTAQAATAAIRSSGGRRIAESISLDSLSGRTNLLGFSSPPVTA